MTWILPGTILTTDLNREHAAEETLSAMFLTGGLVLSQVTQITGLEPYIVQNWVRRGFLSPPQGRKYTRRQVSRILMINALKSALSLEQICQLLQYINGALDDEGDDTIDDTRLYACFLELVRGVELAGFPPTHALDAQVQATDLRDYIEPLPGAKDRILRVLKIMLLAWRSAQLQDTAQKLLAVL